GAAPVQILVHLVEAGLVVGIAVNGGHHAAFDADGIVQNLGDRHQAVGGAGSVRYHQHVLGELVVVDAIDHGQIGAVAGRRHQHALGAGGQVCGSLVLGREDAGAFQGDIHAQFLVRQLGRVL